MVGKGRKKKVKSRNKRKSRKEKAERKKSGYVDITQTLTYFQQEIYEIYMGNIIPLESTDQKDNNVDYIVNYFGISWAFGYYCL